MISSFLPSVPAGSCRFVLTLGLLVALLSGPRLEAAGVVTHRSKNFILHTDDDPDRAKQLLEKLERMLGIVSTYWRRPNRHMIECCVVKDLENWPAGRLPPLALKKIRSGSGVTLTVKRMQGKAFMAKSVVYAVANTATTQHEAVHAYCHQMFGSSGPVWYSEGMAEMGRYWANDGDRSVRADRGPIRYLRSLKPPPLKTLTRSGETSDGWQHYAQRWALCHLLANNPNYGQRFRTLGFSLLGKRPGASYLSFFGTMNREIEFEYKVFLRNLENGYRVDLCNWDWKSRFRRHGEGREVMGNVEAGRGWQASGVAVQADRAYKVTATGRWQTAADTEPVDADGDAKGGGRLQAVIWSDYQLSRAVEVGSEATIKPARDGRLFLRCGDGWGRLHDNTGRITVRVKLEPK